MSDTENGQVTWPTETFVRTQSGTDMNPKRVELLLNASRELVIGETIRLMNAIRKDVREATGSDGEPNLRDPVVVHINMMSGAIAKPTIEQLRHLYPELLIEEKKR